MKRDYIDGIKEDADFFVGKEVETTPTKGMQTLFVVGLQRTATVLKHAENNKCKHIYFGANHSFKVLGNIRYITKSKIRKYTEIIDK